MPRKQELRSAETRRDILSTAGKLFAERGFDAVTMREIAGQAGCSHTTIYIHFKDKEALLHELSMPSLQELKQRMENILLHRDLPPEERLKGISREFIRFCLQNRTMYTIFFEVKSVRVDEERPVLPINQLRNGLFRLLQQALQDCLDGQRNDTLLTSARIFFFMIHGIVGTYTYSDETPEALMERLSPTFDEAVDVLLLGFRQQTVLRQQTIKGGNIR
ncbi:MAG: TetR/AcrR family transcriptional regulator [Bacilli bacterium]